MLRRVELLLGVGTLLGMVFEGKLRGRRFRGFRWELDVDQSRVPQCPDSACVTRTCVTACSRICWPRP